MSRHPLALTLTASQTVGPFFGPAMLRPDAARNVVTEDADPAGERIRIEGRVYDGDRLPVPDALVEIWQANAHGRYNHPADSRPLPLEPNFLGFGRSGTDRDGGFWFDTVKPGPVPAGDGAMQAPHIVVSVFARGLLNHVVTRLYFADEPSNAADGAAGHAAGGADPGRRLDDLPLRHRPPGRGRDRVLQPVTWHDRHQA